MLNLIYIALACVFLFVYVWSFYNLPILAVGVRHLRKSRNKSAKGFFTGIDLPAFSIVVPVKNEDTVVGRLLDALSMLTYPADKMEIIIVEDGSCDGTLDICMKYAEESRRNVKILHRAVSNGKPSALNYGVMHAKGDIIAIFDADNVPAHDTLLNVCKYFEDPYVAAVQGRTLSINSEENMLTKFISYEEAVLSEVFLRGRDALNLYVNLTGSCQFLRRSVLENLKGFDEKALSEDIEISARITEKEYRIRYAPDVRSWQETPSDLRQLLGQRTRWLRGHIQAAFKYGRLMAKPNWKSIDAEAMLFSPLILIASLVTYFAAFYIILLPLTFSLLLQFLMQFAAVSLTSSLLVCGLALVYVSKQRSLASVLWLPFVYFYWSFQAFIALYAVLLILLRRPRKWTRTDKKGTVTNSKVLRSSTL